MFIHSFKYAWIELFRSKSQMFWCLAFPMILGTMFFLAFGKLTSGGDFAAIPVAVVLDDSDQATDFKEIIDQMSEPGDDQIFSTTYTTEADALDLLEQKEITGILYGGESVSLTISSDMTSAKLEQSILSSFIQTFQMNYDALMNVAATHPENLAAAIEVFSSNTTYNQETTYSDGSLDEATTYFFNLLAMSCLFACMSGCVLATQNQANLSDLGARKNISPVNKLISIAGDLAANILIQFLCVFITLLYLEFVLKVDFGDQFLFTILGVFVGCLTGVSFGFFIGSLGHMNQYVKEGILMGGTMFCCFLSGLMMGNIRIYIEKFAPIVNKINPAALISDSFYALSIYSSYDRYWKNIITLLILSFIFYFGGFLCVRREKYASL